MVKGRNLGAKTKLLAYGWLRFTPGWHQQSELVRSCELLTGSLSGIQVKLGPQSKRGLGTAEDEFHMKLPSRYYLADARGLDAATSKHVPHSPD